MTAWYLCDIIVSVCEFVDKIFGSCCFIAVVFTRETGDGLVYMILYQSLVGCNDGVFEIARL